MNAEVLVGHSMKDRERLREREGEEEIEETLLTGKQKCEEYLFLLKGRQRESGQFTTCASVFF